MRSNKPNPLTVFKDRAEERRRSWERFWPNRPSYRVCVEGMGDWGKNTYMPAVRNAKVRGIDLTALYRDLLPTLGDKTLEQWEQFEVKKTPASSIINAQDLLIVATPDSTHVEILEASAGRFAVALVEKPFCTNEDAISRTKALIESGAQVWGIDHYPFYIANALPKALEIWQYLGGECARIEFALLQSHPIEKERLASLELGLGYDMLSHFFAILAALGLAGTVQRLVVRDAAQHTMPLGLNFSGETCLDIEFQIDNPMGHGTIDCRAVAGKGLPMDIKYLDLIGYNGAVVRFDLGSNSWRQRDYPHDRVSFLVHPDSHRCGSKEYLGFIGERWHVTLGPNLDTKRPYNQLLAGIVSGKLDANLASCLFSIGECEWIVSTLEYMRSQLGDFLHGHKGKWPKHALGEYPSGWSARI